MARRVYVRIVVEIDERGELQPVRVFWEDGRVFDVECLLSVHRATHTHTGGRGMCYTCRLNGRQARIFEDEGRWFVEARDKQASD